MNSFSIFNLNCWLFPPPLSVDGNIRIANILGMIKERDPDIITLQEVWSNKYLRYLIQKLPNYFAISSKSPFYNQSGLVTFVKQKPLSTQVNFFQLSVRHNFTEWFLHKGYIIAVLELNGEKFTVINTHLYAPFSMPAEVIPEDQFQKLINIIPQNQALVCGDLNASESVIKQVSQGKFIKLCDSQPTSDVNNPYCHKRFNSLMSNESKKIDYLLLKSNLPVKSGYEMIKSPFVSDHYAMFCKISLEK